MKIGITGSSGFIGSQLLNALPESEPWKEGLLYDVVINLAGENIASSRWSKEKKQRIVESRLAATRAIGKNPPKVLISASAITPPGTFLEHVVDEWERAAVEVGAERTVCMRLGVVLSKKGGALPRMTPPFKACLGGRLGDGKQTFVM